MGTEVKPGDQVRVTIETEVWARELDGSAVEFRVVDKDGFYRYLSVDPATVEKVEPPVEVFKPGDVVRDRNLSGYRYLVGQDGYYSFLLNRWFPADSSLNKPEDFTSDRFERVEP